jgi:ferredoxin
LQILHDTEEAGLVHTIGNYRDGHNYICNCCTCCCGILRGVAEFDIPTAIAHSGFQAVVDSELCIGCGDCVERCQFGAREVPEDVCEADVVRCVGCGVCVSVCPADALHLERRLEEEAFPLADDLKDWMSQRAEERGISMSDIL